MKRISVFVGAIALVLGFSTLAHADLTVVGVDVYGNQLIYDSYFNITWYDYTYMGPSGGGATWSQANNWAQNLTVATVNGVSITGWSLPSQVDVSGYVGQPMWNITTSEMGHLFYTELGNKGYRDVNGNYPQPGWGLVNTGPFKNLLADYYWTGTEYAPEAGYAWAFSFYGGSQDPGDEGEGAWALAVISGDPVPTPIPSAILLLAPGLLGLMAVRRRFKK